MSKIRRQANNSLLGRVTTTIKIGSIAAIAITIASCGFHLRGGQLLPPQMHTMQLHSPNPYSELTINLSRALTASGATITTDKTDAITLQIIASSFTNNNTNMVSSAQATVYTFTYKAIFTLVDNHGNKLIPVQTVTSTRTITMNPNEVLAASNEVGIIKQEMQRDIIFRIINKLNANNTRRALQKHENLSRTTSSTTTKKARTHLSHKR